MKKLFTNVIGVCCMIGALFFVTTESSAQCSASVPACVNQGGAAYTTVITNDPFCCNNTWDGLCVSAYNALTTNCGGAGNGCAAPEPSGSFSCVIMTSAAYSSTISSDPFCCTTAWDALCQNGYLGFGGQCGAAPSCTVVPPACVDAGSSAYASVVSSDPFCCNTGWDGICQNAYNALNGSCTCTVVPPACVITSSFAYNEVIGVDPFCCSNSWDSLCQSQYDALNSSCAVVCITPPPCVDVNSGAYATVIANDPFCCNNGWDTACQAAYDALSTTCTGPVCGVVPPACVDTSSPAYSNVVANDPFCCNNSWDSICQNSYNALNGSCTCTVVPPACVNTLGFAYNQVIGVDPFCCTNSWDALCQSQYDALSGTCTVDCPALGLNIGDPCLAGVFNGTVDANCQCIQNPCAAVPACVAAVPSAYTTVINADPFCCNNSWDSICQAAFDAISTSCTGPVCNVNGGTVSTLDQRTGLCRGDGKPDPIQLTVTGNVGAGLFGLVLQSNLNVVATNTTGFFNMETFPAGNYFVGHVSVPNLSALQGITNVNQLTGCFDLSNSLAVTSIQLNGGTLVATSPTTVCTGNVSVSVAAAIGPNQRYVLLNQTATTSLAINTTGVFNLTSLPNGVYRAVSISYSGSVNLGAIQPPTLPACVAASNLVTFTKVACATPVLESSPNPTSGASFVTFTIPTEEHTTLEVFDMSGRKVTELFRQVTQPDVEYRLEFDGSGLPNGVYVYRLTTGSDVIIDKFMIAR